MKNEDESWQRKGRTLLLLGLPVAIVVGVMGLGSTILPMGGDQGNYAYAAWAWSEGFAPYRDVWLFKPPVTMFIHSIANTLFGNTMVGIRFVDLFWTICTSLTLTYFTFLWTEDKIASVGAGLLYGLLYFQFDYWHTAQTDGWMNLPIVASLVFSSRAALGKSDLRRLMFLAGLALSVATFLKYTALAALLPVGMIVWSARRERVKSFILWLGLGFAAFATLLVLWLVFIGALPAFIDHHLNVLPQYATQSTHGRGLGGIWRAISGMFHFQSVRILGFCLIFGLGGLLFEFGRHRERAGQIEAQTTPRLLVFHLVTIGLLIAALASLISQGKYFRYQYLPVIAPSALLGASLLITLTKACRSWIRVFFLFCVVVAISVNSAISASLEDWRRVSNNDIELHEFWSSPEFNGGYSVAENLLIAGWIHENTQPSDTVFIWGREPLPNYLAKRLRPTSFISNHRFRMPERPKALDERLLQELRSNAPPFVLIHSSDPVNYMRTIPGAINDSWSALEEFEELSEWVTANYEPVTRIERYLILERKE